MSKKNKNPWGDIIFNVLIPSLILMKLSGPEKLGQFNAFIVALAFPIFYGIYEFIKEKKFSGFAAFGFVSVLLTGGLGLFKVDGFWFAVKEAAIPLIIGIAVLVSMKFKPLIKVMVYNENLIDIDKVDTALAQKNNKEAFEKLLKSTNYLFASSFFLSAILNFVLASIILKSPSGTEAFNQELGKMTALSFPVIMVPSMMVMMITVWKLIKGITNLTGLKFEDIMKQH